MNKNWLKNIKRDNGKTNLLAVILLSYFKSFGDNYISLKRKDLADILGYKKRMISRSLRFLEDRELITRRITRYPYLAIYINDIEKEKVRITDENTIEDIKKYYKEKYEGKKFETKITYRSQLVIILNNEKIEAIS